MDWDYRLEPQANYSGSAIYPRGKTLGGSSAINSMVYIRGNRADFDGWGQRGCTGWDYDSVLPYFMKAEANSRLGEPLHGRTGPLHVEDRLFTHELSDAGRRQQSNGACRATMTSTATARSAPVLTK